MDCKLLIRLRNIGLYTNLGSFEPYTASSALTKEAKHCIWKYSLSQRWRNRQRTMTSVSRVNFRHRRRPGVTPRSLRCSAYRDSNTEALMSELPRKKRNLGLFSRQIRFKRFKLSSLPFSSRWIFCMLRMSG